MLHRMSKACVALLLIVVCASSARSQSLHEIQDTVKHYMTIINKSRYTPTRPANKDSLKYADVGLMHYMLSALPNTMESMTTELHAPGIFTQTSPDHRLKIWGWDTGEGDSLPAFRTIAEYIGERGIIATDLMQNEGFNFNFSGYCDTIYQVTTNSGARVYIPIIESKWSSVRIRTELEPCQIIGDSLYTDVEIFRSKEQKSGSFGYTTVVSPKSANNKLHMSRDGKTLYFPLLRDHVVTSTSYSFVFDGECFVYQGFPEGASQSK